MASSIFSCDDILDFTCFNKKRNAHPTSSPGGARKNVKFATPPCDKAKSAPNPQGALAQEDPQNDQSNLPSAKHSMKSTA